MRRRAFLKLGGGASLAFMINGLPVSTYASQPLLELLAKQTGQNGRVLVLIQLNGGNDGLNTVIPLDQYSTLSAARANILLPQQSVLPITGTLNTGLHPAMTAVRDMYNNGLVNITQGVSYPNPNFSHFRATDIWNSASDANQFLSTGWLGRYLGETYNGYPTGYPNASMPDPLAIQIGTGVSPVLQGPTVNMGMAISSISSFYNIVNGTVDPAPATPAGHELTFIRYISQQTQQYTSVIQTAAQNAANLSTQYPATGNSLADQLKIVARLIAGGLQTPIYVVSMGSFDTHSAQTDSVNTSIGAHAALLKQLSDAVGAFYDDCKKLNIDNRVAAMTFSEFGRRIVSNASGGTDHGTAAPVMVFGPGVNPGIIGTNPVIPANVTANDNLAMQHDYRDVYSAVLADWFGVDTQVLDDVLLQQFTVLPIFKKSTSVSEPRAGDNEALGQNYPNPFSSVTTITFAATGDEGVISIELYDVSGRRVKTLAKGQYARGSHEVQLYREGMAAGTYILRYSSGKQQASRKIVAVD